MLASTLRAAVSQRLVPRADGEGRVAGCRDHGRHRPRPGPDPEPEGDRQDHRGDLRGRATTGCRPSTRRCSARDGGRRSPRRSRCETAIEPARLQADARRAGPARQRDRAGLIDERRPTSAAGRPPAPARGRRSSDASGRVRGLTRQTSLQFVKRCAKLGSQARELVFERLQRPHRDDMRPELPRLSNRRDHLRQVDSPRDPRPRRREPPLLRARALARGDQPAHALAAPACSRGARRSSSATPTPRSRPGSSTRSPKGPGAGAADRGHAQLRRQLAAERPLGAPSRARAAASSPPGAQSLGPALQSQLAWQERARRRKKPPLMRDLVVRESLRDLAEEAASVSASSCAPARRFPTRCASPGRARPSATTAPDRPLHPRRTAMIARSTPSGRRSRRSTPASSRPLPRGARARQLGRPRAARPRTRSSPSSAGSGRAAPTSRSTRAALERRARPSSRSRRRPATTRSRSSSRSSACRCRSARLELARRQLVRSDVVEAPARGSRERRLPAAPAGSRSSSLARAAESRTCEIREDSDAIARAADRRALPPRRSPRCACSSPAASASARTAGPAPAAAAGGGSRPAPAARAPAATGSPTPSSASSRPSPARVERRPHRARPPSDRAISRFEAGLERDAAARGAQRPPARPALPARGRRARRRPGCRCGSRRSVRPPEGATASAHGRARARAGARALERRPRARLRRPHPGRGRRRDRGLPARDPPRRRLRPPRHTTCAPPPTRSCSPTASPPARATPPSAAETSEWEPGSPDRGGRCDRRDADIEEVEEHGRPRSPRSAACSPPSSRP